VVASAQEAHDVVQASPLAVAAHDKARWVALFDDDYVIEDPVGSRPVRGDMISGFWDAFIAPNDIEFVVHHDWVATEGDRRWHVVRDVTIVTTLATGIQVRTPAHLRYELVEREEGLKVERMAAHWEPAPVFGQLLRPRAAYVRSLAAMSVSMLRHLGLGGTARFVGAVRSVGKKGKAAVRAHLGSSVTHLDKLIASGNVVTASCRVDGAPAAVIATLDPSGNTVLDCRIYTDLVG